MSFEGFPVSLRSLFGNRISATRVMRSAPCGSTWYMAQQIKWSASDDVETLKNVISKAHHGYPCTASMQMDSELKDTILHKSGYIIRNAVEDALMKAKTQASTAVPATAEPRPSARTTLVVWAAKGLETQSRSSLAWACSPPSATCGDARKPLLTGPEFFPILAKPGGLANKMVLVGAHAVTCV